MSKLVSSDKHRWIVKPAKLVKPTQEQIGKDEQLLMQEQIGNVEKPLIEPMQKYVVHKHKLMQHEEMPKRLELKFEHKGMQKERKLKGRRQIEHKLKEHKRTELDKHKHKLKQMQERNAKQHSVQKPMREPGNNKRVLMPRQNDVPNVIAPKKRKLHVFKQS